MPGGPLKVKHASGDDGIVSQALAQVIGKLVGQCQQFDPDDAQLQFHA